MIEVKLIYQTETLRGGVCFHAAEAQAGPLFGGEKPEDVWLPLASIKIEGDHRRGAVVKVTLPERLAIKKGLV